MPRKGGHRSLLDELHVEGCDGQEYSICRPVAFPDPEGGTGRIEVVFAEWCGDCGAADYEVV